MFLQNPHFSLLFPQVGFDASDSIISHGTPLFSFFLNKAFGENVVLQLIFLQNANGSWKLDENLTKILGTTLEDTKAANPSQVRCKKKQGEGCVLHEVRNIMKIGVNQGPGKK